jgi:putative YhbY family RNA-binding protein
MRIDKAKTMLPLSSAERRDLRAKAHGLSPVVMVSSAGLSEAVVGEIDRALVAHELIKVRAFSDDREQRETWLNEVCARLMAAPVQHIGKTLVLYRPPRPEDAAKAGKKTARPRGPRKTKKQMLAAK